MRATDKAIFTISCLLVFCWLVYLIKSVLAPFVCSLVIAYFLDPMVDYLHVKSKIKISRLMATSLILGLFMVTLTALGVIFLPIIYNQAAAMFEALPGYFQTITNDFYPKIAESLNKFGFKVESSFSDLVQNQHIADRFVNYSQDIFTNLVSSSIALINVLSLIFLTPILVFYLLKDWDVLMEKIAGYLPRAISSSTKKVAADIDASMSGYIRGQIQVCLIIGITYAILLTLAGLNFGFLIGFLTGLLLFIPYVGALCGFAVGLIIALLQWGIDPGHLTAIISIFIFGQIIESNFLTPKLIGSKIGLHPVWVIFGLFVFGALFGFVGVIAAVPLTATSGVVIKHFALEYKKRFT